MRAILKPFIDFIRKPEWVAAIALLLQVIILWLQARILRQHGKTMEEHATVAKEQAGTAELIGKALEQHAAILGEQAKLTEAQFKFQRWLTVQAAREQVYDYMVQLFASVTLLIATVEAPGNRYPERIEKEMMAQSQVIGALLPAQKATLTCAHLSDEERKYLKDYTVELKGILPQDNLPAVLPKLKALDTKYKDIVLMITQIAQPPDMDHPKI
jgi:hypothetical protein